MNHPTSNRRCLSYRRVIRHSRKNLQIEAVCMGAYGAGMEAWFLGCGKQCCVVLMRWSYVANIKKKVVKK